MPKFIVLSGKKQAGKTTVANHLYDILGDEWNVRITSFAAPIKEFCINVIGLTKQQVYGTDEDKNSPTHIMWDNMPKEIRTRYGTIQGDIKVSRTLYDWVRTPAKGPMTAREVMQIFGTDVMRTFFNFDIWAEAPFAKKWNEDIVIIDDCRFPNEADIALKNNAILIRLLRNPLEDTHVSEMALDDYDISKYNYTIDNSVYEDTKPLEMHVDVIMRREGL